MPPRSAVSQLPAEDKEWLDQELIRRGFSGYVELAEALKARGYHISKSAVHSYGQEFETRVADVKFATEQAKAFVKAVPDDEGAITEALVRLVQEKIFQLLMRMRELGTDVPIEKLGKLIADLARAAVTQKRWAAEVEREKKAAAEEVKEVAKAGGLTDETVEAIYNRVLGIKTVVKA